MEGKRYTRFSCRIHAGYTQIDNMFHVCDYRGVAVGYTQNATRVWKNQHLCSQQKPLFCRLTLEYC